MNRLAIERIGCVLLFLAVLAGLLQLIFQLTLLPEKVATHFGPNGAPDGFMSRTSHATFQVALILGMPIFLLGLGRLSRYMPNSMVNIPNKAYYLHPDRRDQTLATTNVFLVWITVVTEAFFIGLSHLLFTANIEQSNLSTVGFTILMSVYFAAIFGMSLSLLWIYRLPKSAT